MIQPEDSGHSIFVLVITSLRTARKLPAGFESEFLPWTDARCASQIPYGYSSANRRADPLVQRMRERKSINPFVAEFFSHGILRRLGIKTVPQIVCSATEARELGTEFVVKIAGEVPAQRLNWESDEALKKVKEGWCLASRLVPDAATLDFVTRKLDSAGSARTQVLRQCAAMHASKDIAFEELIAKALGKSCEPADRFFADFRPTPTELERMHWAIQIDGLSYLRICAARVFLGVSAPHFGNVLVTKAAELVSIDHARASLESGEDLRMLFKFVHRNSSSFEAIGNVTNLTEDDIRESICEIPDHPAIGSTAGLADYFCARLKIWKELCAGDAVPSVV